MNRDNSILLVGHDDIIENGLFDYFQSKGYSKVYSTTRLGLNPTIQPSVYAFFQKYRPEYVFCASTRSGGIEANKKYGAEFLYHNSESQNNIFYAAQKFGTKKIVYFAGSCVYPAQSPQPIKEEYLLTGPLEKANEPYSIAKIAGIKLCETFQKQYGLESVALVPATIYGPQSDVDLETAHVMGALIGKFVKAIAANETKVEVWGTGQARREFIYIDDLIDAAVFLMNTKLDVPMVNVGVSQDISIKELSQAIAKCVGFDGIIEFNVQKPEGSKQKLLDSGVINALGWHSKVNLTDGIKKTIEWYKTTGVLK